MSRFRPTKTHSRRLPAGTNDSQLPSYAFPPALSALDDPNSPIGLSNLPPLPPGFTFGQLAQFGNGDSSANESLALAIRLGMGIGMGLGGGPKGGPQRDRQSSADLQAVESWLNAAAPTSPSLERPPSSPSLSRSSGVSRRTDGLDSASTSTSGTDKKATLASEFLNDSVFPPAASPVGGPSTASTSVYSSPLTAFSPSVTATAATSPAPGNLTQAGLAEEGSESPEELSKQDPLALSVWKLYTKQKAELPNGQRMENLTWRMMAMTLKKKEAAEAAAAAAAAALQGGAATSGDDQGSIIGRAIMPSKNEPIGSAAAEVDESTSDATPEIPREEESRGRRGRPSRVVLGFDARNLAG